MNLKDSCQSPGFIDLTLKLLLCFHLLEVWFCSEGIIILWTCPLESRLSGMRRFALWVSGLVQVCWAQTPVSDSYIYYKPSGCGVWCQTTQRELGLLMWSQSDHLHATFVDSSCWKMLFCAATITWGKKCVFLELKTVNLQFLWCYLVNLFTGRREKA